MYLESNDALDVHVEHSSIQGNHLTGRGGGISASVEADEAELVLSIHDSDISHNTVSGWGIATGC